MRNHRLAVLASIISISTLSFTQLAQADETCLSPYTTSLIKGQEKYLQVWTLGVKGMGDESDKLVTIDVDPDSKTYRQGRQFACPSAGAARRTTWASPTIASRSGPAVSTTTRFSSSTSAPIPPSRNSSRPSPISSRRPALSARTPSTRCQAACWFRLCPTSKDHGGETGIAIYSNDGEYICRRSRCRPPMVATATATTSASIRRKNVLLTSSFTGWNNYMMDFGKLVKDPEAMKNFGKHHGAVES